MIDPAVIASVCERTDIVKVIGESMRLTKRGRSFTGLCPFHKEKTPSFHVSAERARFHCFGCKESGDVIEFVMKSDGKSFIEAVTELAERAGIEIGDDRTDAERREASAAQRAREDLYAVNALAATFFEHALVAHPLAGYAREELARRGLGRAELDGAVAGFRIGYAPASWDAFGNYLKQQGVSHIAAEKVGLLVPRQGQAGGYYDRFRHRLMFPVIDTTGRVVAFSGRKLDGAGDDRETAKYVNSPESPIYTKGDNLYGLWQGKAAIRHNEAAILVEGNFDVVSLHARGITTAVAPLGTALTQAQAKLLKRFAPKVIVMFDGDAAGKKATRAARGPIADAGLHAKVAAMPGGTDPDDLVRKQGGAGLDALIEHAHGMLEHLIDETLEAATAEGASIEERQGAIDDVAKILREENDPGLRMMAKFYADRIAAKFTIGGRSMRDLAHIERALNGDNGQRQTSEERSTWAPESLGLAIVGAVLDHPSLTDDPEVQASAAHLSGDDALAYAAICAAREGDAFDVVALLSRAPEGAREFLAGRLAAPGTEPIARAKRGVSENAAKLQRLDAIARRRERAQAKALSTGAA